MVMIRRDVPPGQITERLALPKGDRVLGAALVDDGGTWLLATTKGFGIVGEDEAVHTPWTGIERVTLDKETGRLAIYFAGRPAARFDIQPKDKRLASIVNERVISSVVTVDHLEVPGGSVRVALRRGDDDELSVQVVAPPEVDLEDEDTARIVGAAKDSLREAAGLPPEA
jgi:hypothetical protein